MTNPKLEEILHHLDKASLIADELSLVVTYATDPFVMLANQIDAAIASARHIQTRPQVALDSERIVGFLNDGRLRTYDEVQDATGTDPREALNKLLEDGRISITHAAGVTFYQRHP